MPAQLDFLPEPLREKGGNVREYSQRAEFQSGIKALCIAALLTATSLSQSHYLCFFCDCTCHNNHDFIYSNECLKQNVHTHAGGVCT